MSSANDILCNRLRKSDKKALDEIYALYFEKMFRFAVSYLKDEDDAMDIIQEVFIKLWESRENLKKESRLEPLIYSIVKNTIISLFRKKSTEKKYLDYLEKSVISNNNNVEELTDYDFLKEQYRQIVPKLPPERRSIFLLSREEGLTNKEIAERKGISEKTVENQMTQALSFIKDQLHQTGILSVLYYYLFIS